MKKNQKGFGQVGIILAILMIGIVGFSGWLVWNKNRSTDKPTLKTTSIKSDAGQKKQALAEKLSGQTYKNEEAGLTFQYPGSWNNRDELTRSHHPGQEQDFWGIDGEITAPSGNVIEWHYWLVGGKGGGCEPNPDDIVFEADNECASKQILEVEKIPSVVSVHPIAKNLFQTNLYITKTRYRPAGAGDITYSICLDAYFDEDIPQKNSPAMNLLFRCQFWDTGLNMTYSVKTQDDLYSDEAKIVEQIMKSVKAL